MLPINHYTVHTRWPHLPFTDRAACEDLWGRLRAKFPTTFGSILMPDHTHTALPGDPELVKRELMRVLADFTRYRFPGKNVWLPVHIEPIANVAMLLRVTRYIHLNPCRDHLTHDPCAWEWSTHRDVVGAVSDPWLDVDALKKAWRRSGAFAQGFHHFVSADESVDVRGTPAPVRSTEPIVSPLSRIREAILQVDRKTELDFVGRRRVLVLAERLGSPDRKLLCQLLDRSRITLWRNSRALPEDEASLQAATLVLSDSRLWTPAPVRTKENVSFSDAGSGRVVKMK